MEKTELSKITGDPKHAYSSVSGTLTSSQLKIINELLSVTGRRVDSESPSKRLIPRNTLRNQSTLGSFTQSRDGVVVRALASHQCVPGSMHGPGVICGLSLLLVLFSAPRGFSPGTPVFPSPQKPTFLKSQFDPWMHGHFWTSSCELLGAPWVNKLHLHLHFILLLTPLIRLLTQFNYLQLNYLRITYNTITGATYNYTICINYSLIKQCDTITYLTYDTILTLLTKNTITDATYIHVIALSNNFNDTFILK